MYRNGLSSTLRLIEARRLQVLADKAPGKTENSSVYYLLGYDMIELN